MRGSLPWSVLALVFIHAESRRVHYSEPKAPWSMEPVPMPEDFKPPASNPSDIAQFKNSIGKAVAFVEKVTIDQTDPFPELDEFFVFSSSKNTWYAFRRDGDMPETFPPLPVGARPEFLQNSGPVSKQVVITVQSTQNDLYCKANIDQRIDCAIAYDRRVKYRNAATAGSWILTLTSKGEGASYKDLSHTFGGSVSKAIASLRKDNGRSLGVDSFVVRKRDASKSTYLFKRETVTQRERVKFALAYRGKKYPKEVCPGSEENGDVVKGKVFPFPGASAWQLQSKWVSYGKPLADSPILDMEDDWSSQIQELNEHQGRVRIYFVGHSAKRKDFFGDRTGRHYNSKSVAQKLVDAGMSSTRPFTLSFVACNGADLFCPSLAEELQHRGYRQVYLFCREPQASRYTGGSFKKKVIDAASKHVKHKVANSKTIFFTASSNPRQGVSAY